MSKQHDATEAQAIPARPLASDPSLFITPEGKVYSQVTKAEVKPDNDSAKGYHFILVKGDAGKMIQAFIHELTALAFHVASPPFDHNMMQDWVVVHKNKDIHDNRLENLDWERVKVRH